MQVEAKYLIEQARELLADDNISRAIKTLQLIADSIEASEARLVKPQLAHIASRFDELEVYVMADTIDRGFAAMQKGKMIQQLKRIADKLEVSLKHKKFDVEIRITGPVEKNVSDWFQTLFA